MQDNSAPEKSGVAAILAQDSASGRSSLLKRILATVVIFIFGALLLFWWQRDPSDPAPQYKTQAIVRSDLKVIVTAAGNLAPVNQVQVGSELSGIVKSVEVDYNDRVLVGQVLARLDTSKLAAQVLQSRASLESARAKVLQTRATVDETTRNWERLQSVVEISQGKAVSKHDLEASRAALDRAGADLASAEAAVSQNEAVLKVIETDLAKAVIHSPINGIVLSRSVDPGQTVAASLQAPVLFSLAEDLAKMELHVDVDEADVGQVKAGQDAIFTVDAYPERRFPARISQVRYGAKTVGGVVTYETLLEVDNSDLSLRPGMTATANITVKEVVDVLLVPNAALRFVPPTKVDGNNNQVGGSVLNRLFPRPRHGSSGRKEAKVKGGKKSQRVWMMKEGILTPIPVTTGATDGVFTEIAGDLQAGQELVVDSINAKP
ncbi:MAG: efflux RND transporter periplasmic adaptor subunit [Proteobacteria bacterium]|nr:efflux RND transporter periplasmic adaptor subunit [Pseudomonadota bacterium]MBU1715615.1 efflux RND transporter periplasmic adaptor subunit [Pseudomonadota bacterium]